MATSADGTTYYRFHGIPYTNPPVGNLRFAAPQEPASWSGVRQAVKFRRDCFKAPSIGSEDCLYINVYTPQVRLLLNISSIVVVFSPVRSAAVAERLDCLPPIKANRSKSPSRNASLLPVMVYIHGGAFVSGSANTGPGQLMDHGVVMATISYRLNLFGFMSIEGTDAPGNAGLKDQVAALKLIQKNIEHFGGNPKSITIFGVSAGGASVQYHMLSPMSKVCQLDVRAGKFSGLPYIAGSARRESGASFKNSGDAFWKDLIDNFEDYVVPHVLGLTRGSRKSKEVAQKVKQFYFGNASVSYNTSE
ncbi:hypothetical protein PR048_018167 [Dryococelus australis]|uniref:Carboxylic ester hydrolase n=1 Tax=Dryococelus australis TaxID=614101 RepID=A0ABQ9HBN2_9NEOP|nr:hypothetical protein PR048_018167 [Dryococelus australis]